MHICIPDTREIRPQHGSAYLLYNVHIDGLYHCSLRYKQLLHLHQALSKKFASSNSSTHQQQHLQMPQFPPKKFLPLSTNQVEERRQQLEKYLQNISQDKTISQSSIFNLFLLEAQRESTRIEEKHVHLDIELVNGQKIRLPLVTHNSADTVLTTVCRLLGLKDRYHAYFCLCLCGYDVVRDKLIIKRRLSFFEAPFITLQMAIQQQEQLQSVLSGTMTTASPSANSVSNHLTSSNNNISNINNNLDLNCSCLNCSSREPADSSINSSTTTGVPCSSSSNSMINNSNSNFSTNTSNTTNTNLLDHHSNQHQRVPCNGVSSENIYYQTVTTTSNNNWQASQTFSSWSQNGQTNRSFVTHRILLRKSYWDPIYDSYILNDQQALNLLFIQTVYDMKHSLMFVDRDTYQQLESLLANDSKLEYILLARTLKYYNYVHFEPCYSDYPRPRTKVMISIGSKELNMRVLKNPRSLQQNTLHMSAAATTTSTPTAQVSSSPATNGVGPRGGKSEPVLYCTSSLVPSGYRDLITKDDLIEEEYNFKVPLIRCWRLTSLETLNSSAEQQNQHQQRQATTTLAGGKRKSFSLFNSFLGNSNGSIDQQHSTSTAAYPNSSLLNTRTVANGTDGHSMMASLISRSESNNNGNHHCATSSNSAGTGHSFSHYRNNQIADHGVECRQQFCQQHNHEHNLAATRTNIDHTQLSQYELSFEYLVSKDTLKWITISSDQAIFISISLQGVVDELVSKRDCFEASTEPLFNQPELSLQIANDGPTPTQARVSRSSSSTSANASTPPISIVPARNGSTSASSQRQELSESFTYLYRDGAQKLLKTQSIDRICATLGGSPTHHASYSSARGGRATLTASGVVLPQSAPSNSSRLMQANGNGNSNGGGFWNLDTRGLAASPSRYLFGYGQTSNNNHSSFEITNVKKAPSPIINDAFEGVTNDEDL